MRASADNKLAVAFCSTGVLQKVVAEYVETTGFNYNLFYFSIYTFLVEILDEYLDKVYSYSKRIESFNDSKSHQEVICVFDGVIDFLSKDDSFFEQIIEKI